MNWKKITILMLLSLILTLLDVSFFTSIPIAGATIISTYAVIINFSILKNNKNNNNENFIFEAISLIFFSIFSSVPIWLLLIAFFIIPGTIFYLRKNYFPAPSIIVSIAFFALANLFFDLILLVYFSEYNLAGLKSLLYFVLINTIIGVAIYSIANYLKVKRQEIKI